ncbi:MAG: hypothetical protein ACREN7_09785 [Candidatus Dormibacteria bacterium]
MSFVHRPHARTTAILSGTGPGPAKVADQLDRSNAVSRLNASIAVKVTAAVGSMWCAYIFAILALIGLPAALKPGGEGFIAWIAQTFLQLVLLSIIIVGTNVQSAAADQRASDTYADAEAVLHEAMQIQEHLKAQDEVLESIVTSRRASAGARPPKAAHPSAG